MKLTRYEQETVVNYNAGEQIATLYTRDKTVMRKLDTLVADFPDTYKLTGQNEVSKSYSFPKSHISYRKPRAVRQRQVHMGELQSPIGAKVPPLPPPSELCVQTKAKVRLLSAHKVYECAPLPYWQNVGAAYG